MPSRQRGFTLIEIMVALAVFSLAAMALIRLQGATIRSTGVLDATLVAQIVARNVAIDAVTDPRPPTVGVSKGVEQNGGRLWAWTRAIRPTGDARVFRVDVTVVDPAGTVLGRLTMVRPPQSPITVSVAS